MCAGLCPAHLSKLVVCDPHFHQPNRALTVGAFLAAGGGSLPDDADPDLPLAGPASAAAPSAGSAVFVEEARGIDLAQLAVCALVLCRKNLGDRIPQGPVVVAVSHPQYIFQDALLALYPASIGDAPVGSAFNSGSLISSTARLESDVTIEPGAVIGDDVAIGTGSVIGANAVIARGCRIGRNTHVGAGTSIQYALIGDHVRIAPGVRIGQEGFGFVGRADGLRKMPQLGRVIIQDRVEIGANSCVDRGALSDTVIGIGTKIDNLVQVAHNVVIGTHCAIAGQCGIAGSARIGDMTMLGGGVGIGDHRVIGSRVQVAALSGVMNNIPDGERWAGIPAQPVKAFFREQAAMRRLATAPRERSSDVQKSGEE